jgi:cytochrome c oxidase cbb3-type subunit I
LTSSKKTKETPQKPAGTGEQRRDLSAKAFIITSIWWFVISTSVGLLLAIKFLWPEFMGNTPEFTFGRMRPLHVSGVLFGWLLAADMGLLYFVIPRLCGNRLYSEKLGMFTVIAFNLVITAAVFTTLGGITQGLEYAELPWFLDIGVTLVWVVFGINIFGTILTRKHEKMYVAIWYTMGAIVWTTFVYTAGNFATELFSGVNQANLNWFYVHNAVGLIFTPLGVALAYYLIPKQTGAPLYSHKLSMIGFWTISFIYVWTGAHHMIHGPISQWLQTVSIIFSAMLIIPVWTVIVNFFGTVSGKWDKVRQDPILKYLMTGTTFYLLTCFQGPMQALRSVNAITSKTDWVVGHAHMAVFGAFSFFAVAGCLYAVPRMVKKPLYSQSLANSAFWFMFSGGLIYFVILWIGGFIQGLQWNDTSIPFIDTVKFMAPFWWSRLAGGTLIFTGAVLFLYNITRTFTYDPSSATAKKPTLTEGETKPAKAAV